MPHRAHIVHRSPGRIRLKVPDAKGDKEFFDEVRRTASIIKGVDKVEANPSTGSVVIEHHESDPAVMKQRLENYSESNRLLSIAFPDLEKMESAETVVESDAELLASRSRTATAIVNAVKSLNLGIKRATNNAIDLNLLIPVAVAAYAGFGADLKKQGPLWAIMLLLAMHTTAVASSPRAAAPTDQASS